MLFLEPYTLNPQPEIPNFRIPEYPIAISAYNPSLLEP